MLDRRHEAVRRRSSRPPRRYASAVPLTPATDELIDEAAHRLATASPDAEIILFGSYARGDADEHSDLDFLVIVPQVDNGAEESVRLRRELRGIPVPFDIIVVGREYAERWRDTYGNVVNSALREGKVLAR